MEGLSISEEKYPYLSRKLLDEGKNFNMLHLQIRNFKNWLRGAHYYCAKDNLDQYINEYIFRFNRLNFRASILLKLIDRMISNDPIPYKSMECNVI